MRIFLLEDEDLAAARLTDFAHRYAPTAMVVGWEKTARAGLEWLQKNPAPDLIFSDVELLDGNVFQLWEQLMPACPVIFATAYDQFLLRAFQTNGIAYLLKPYDFEQFSESMQKYERLIAPRSKEPHALLSPDLIEELKRSLQPAFRQYRQRFAVKKTSGIYLLQTTEVAYFQAEEKIVFAYTSDGKRHSLTQTLNELEAELDPRMFFRLNRSDLIHLPFVERLETYDRDRLAVHLRGHTRPMISSAAKTAALRIWLEG